MLHQIVLVSVQDSEGKERRITKLCRIMIIPVHLLLELVLSDAESSHFLCRRIRTGERN